MIWIYKGNEAMNIKLLNQRGKTDAEDVLKTEFGE